LTENNNTLNALLAQRGCIHSNVSNYCSSTSDTAVGLFALFYIDHRWVDPEVDLQLYLQDGKQRIVCQCKQNEMVRDWVGDTDDGDYKGPLLVRKYTMGCCPVDCTQVDLDKLSRATGPFKKEREEEAEFDRHWRRGLDRSRSSGIFTVCGGGGGGGGRKRQPDEPVEEGSDREGELAKFRRECNLF